MMSAFGVAAFSCRQVTAPYRGIQSHRLGRWSLLMKGAYMVLEIIKAVLDFASRALSLITAILLYKNRPGSGKH